MTDYLVPMTQRRHKMVTAGVLDDRAVEAFTSGQCLALAVEYARAAPKEDYLHAVKLMFQEDPKTGQEWFIHAYVTDLMGHKIDATGVHLEERYVGWWAIHYFEYRFRLETILIDDVKNLSNHELSSRVTGTPKQRFDAAKSFAGVVRDNAQRLIGLGASSYTPVR